MDLTFDDEKMDLYPSFQDLEEAVLDILNSILNTLQVWKGYDLIIFTPPCIVSTMYLQRCG